MIKKYELICLLMIAKSPFPIKRETPPEFRISEYYFFNFNFI